MLGLVLTSCRPCHGGFGGCGAKRQRLLAGEEVSKPRARPTRWPNGLKPTGEGREGHKRDKVQLERRSRKGRWTVPSIRSRLGPCNARTCSSSSIYARRSHHHPSRALSAGVGHPPGLQCGEPVRSHGHEGGEVSRERGQWLNGWMDMGHFFSRPDGVTRMLLVRPAKNTC